MKYVIPPTLCSNAFVFSMGKGLWFLTLYIAWKLLNVCNLFYSLGTKNMYDAHSMSLCTSLKTPLLIISKSACLLTSIYEAGILYGLPKYGVALSLARMISPGVCNGQPFLQINPQIVLAHVVVSVFPLLLDGFDKVVSLFLLHSFSCIFYFFCHLFSHIACVTLVFVTWYSTTLPKDLGFAANYTKLVLHKKFSSNIALYFCLLFELIIQKLCLLSFNCLAWP